MAVINTPSILFYLASLENVRLTEKDGQSRMEFGDE
jgi:hypothetical protein